MQKMEYLIMKAFMSRT